VILWTTLSTTSQEWTSEARLCTRHSNRTWQLVLWRDHEVWHALSFDCTSSFPLCKALHNRISLTKWADRRNLANLYNPVCVTGAGSSSRLWVGIVFAYAVSTATCCFKNTNMKIAYERRSNDSRNRSLDSLLERSLRMGA